MGMGEVISRSNWFFEIKIFIFDAGIKKSGKFYIKTILKNLFFGQTLKSIV